jgi:uncharacterized protein YdhG (YjbR/CyaY superfamily)
MRANQPAPNDIDAYIAGFPVEIQQILEQIRATIRAAAPQATETISYQMPAYKLNRILVYFAAHKNHIGFYPTSSVTALFKDALAGYPITKGTVQFPYNKPIPYDIITDMVKFRVAENLDRL